MPLSTEASVPFRDTATRYTRGTPAMKHRSSQILFAHWNEKRANRSAPERAEIDPAGIRAALGDTFILAFNPLTEHPFRLAGTRICALFGRELKGGAFTDLWSDASQPITRLVGTAADEAVGVVAGVTGAAADGRTVELELLVLPLRHCGQSHLRLIGSLAPMTSPYWLGATPLQSLTLGDHRFVGERSVARQKVLTLPAMAGGSQVRRGLVVYEGGRQKDFATSD